MFPASPVRGCFFAFWRSNIEGISGLREAQTNLRLFVTKWNLSVGVWMNGTARSATQLFSELSAGQSLPASCVSMRTKHVGTIYHLKSIKFLSLKSIA